MARAAEDLRKLVGNSDLLANQRLDDRFELGRMRSRYQYPIVSLLQLGVELPPGIGSGGGMWAGSEAELFKIPLNLRAYVVVIDGQHAQAVAQDIGLAEDLRPGSAADVAFLFSVNARLP